MQWTFLALQIKFRMENISLLVCLVFIFAVFEGLLQTEAINPGFKARITSKGLKYANDVAMQALSKNVKKATIPNQSGTFSVFNYVTTNIHVTGFNPPSSEISITPGKGLAWKASNADISIHGDFHYNALFLSDGGSFEATVSGVSFGLQLDIGKDSTGRPTLSATQCTSSLGDVDFQFYGGMSWLYNIFRNTVGGNIKDSLSGQLCELVYKAVNVDGSNKLKDLKVTTKLAKKFLLDYRLSATPTFTPDYMETYHKGEIYWLADNKTECPLTSPSMPDTTNNQNMMYLWISDYMFDSIGYVAQKHDFLVRNLTQADLPAKAKGILNTTCTGLVPCVGTLIPQISKKYPNAVVELRMKSTTVPKMSVSSAGVSLKASGIINMYATRQGSSQTPFLISLGANATTSVKLSIHDELVFAEIENLKVKLTVLKSEVGDVSGIFLDFLVKKALNVYLVPLLNDLGKKGFPLPVTDEIKFTDTKLSLAEDTILISTDLQYTSKDAQQLNDMSGPLKFVPHVNTW